MNPEHGGESVCFIGFSASHIDIFILFQKLAKNSSVRGSKQLRSVEAFQKRE